jgi:hypothetical protein
VTVTSFDSYRNKHNGERCFILGNGPSLVEENLSLLKDEIVFIVNRGYFALDIGLDHYNYYVLTDLRVYSEDFDEIQKLSKPPRFYSSLISENHCYINGPQEPYIPINRFKDNDKRKMGLFRNNFPKNFEDGWGKARTVVFDAALVAYFMGFKEIYFLGVDLTSPSDTQTHFYGTGIREQRLRKDFTGKPDSFCSLVDNFNSFFKKNNVKFINLSKGFLHRVPMQTDTLENILAHKLRT